MSLYTNEELEIIKRIPPERKLEIALRVSEYARKEMVLFLCRLHPRMKRYELFRKANELLEIVENRKYR